jgi:2-dehydro-3-deoxygalactonokinase
MKKFLSCDWGTSSFRLRLVDPDTGEVHAELLTDDGIAMTHQRWLVAGKPASGRISFYRDIIKNSSSHLSGVMDKGLPVICSGMASASIGMIELPYQEFPFSWKASQIGVQKIPGDTEFPNDIFIVSGFKTGDDIMRGEETLLLGAGVEEPADHLFIFPGTHSKHVFVRNRIAVSFRTYMTGEFFNLLTEKSILKNVVRKGMDEISFEEGFRAGLQDNILHAAFQVRTRHLLAEKEPVSNYQYLSGLLIGTELRELKGHGYPVYLVSNSDLSHAYRHGFALMNDHRAVHYLPEDEMLVRGHCKIAELYL